MDLPVIGSHCSLTSCNDLDLLPIRCRCGKLFCRDHISPDTHACPVELISQLPLAEFDRKLRRCALEDCNKPSLEGFISTYSGKQGSPPASCLQCQRSFCAQHRHMTAHSCPIHKELDHNRLRNEAGHDILAQNFPSPSPSFTSRIQPRTRIPSDPNKLVQYQRVQLMKMRHNALPANPKDKLSSTPVDQRLHVKVRVVGSSTEDMGDEKTFWLPKSVSTGKALDVLSNQFGVSSSDSSPLQLVKFSTTTPGEHMLLRNDESLDSQVEQGSTLGILSLGT